MTKRRFTLTPKFLQQYLEVFKQKGLKEGVKAVGFPVAFGLFMFFLVKGVVLYILLPYLIAKGYFTS
ncbi:MAG: hypothetical protein ACPG4S_05705 [Schleiferiaceae bacterium]